MTTRRPIFKRGAAAALGFAPWLLALGVGGALARRPPPAPYVPPQEERARFLGPHPIAAHIGGGFCYIDVPHVHPYAPDHPALYQRVGDEYLFTADPVPFGYEGPKTTYYGHHPLLLSAELGVAPPRPLFCWLRGPHYHEQPPPQAPGFQVQGGVVFYVGPMDPEAARLRPQLEPALEAEYRPYVAQRPQVTVTPPSGWAGEIWVVPPPAPAVQVVAPAAPRVQVVAPSGPNVHIVAPQPPSIHIVAPQPPGIHIVAPQAPRLYVAPPAPVYVVPGWGHPGKHKGWYKHDKHGKGRPW